ncbi:MAG: hypothetical protein JSW25_02435 [Thermoplasmata archaeon]|nr:MAG: hypothetical protein JSW25_02435 [Thermoplasmata archaeon]
MAPGFRLKVIPLLLALALLALASSTQAATHSETYLIEDVYTEEQTTTNRDLILEGETVLDAWFNLTVLEDKINSEPDQFLLTVTNMDDAALFQSLNGFTDDQGRLDISLHFTQEGSPRWRVSVACTEAGDTMLGPIPIEEDGGNAWDLQVDYVYYVDDGTNGNGGNGNGGNGGGEEEEEDPALVTVMQLNLLMVAILSIITAFLSVGVFLRGEGSLKLPLVLAFILALDAFIFLPVALVVNQELNGVIFALPPYGPEWLGNLALILLIVWLVPFIVARKRVLASDMVHSVVSRVTAKKAADAVKGRADGYPEDQLTTKNLALLLVLLGVASVAIVAMMLLT